MGTGAIGSSVGADMTRAGQDVYLIDQWPEHVEAMKSKGLHITMPEGDLDIKVKALHLCEVASVKPFDIVFLTSKSPDTVWLTHFIKPHLAPTGVLVSLQNSLNDEWIAPIIGYQRDVPSVVELAAQILGPGNVRRRTGPTKAWFGLGEMHGRVTTRVKELAGILGVAGKTEIISNIWGAKWSKLIVNTMSHAVAAILRDTEPVVIENPKLYELGIALGRECLDVGIALGYQVEPVFGLTAADMMGDPEKFLKCILETLCKHRIRAISGCPRLLIDLGRDGIYLKRFTFKDPYNPVSAAAILRLTLWKIGIFYIFVAALAWLAWSSVRARPVLALAVLAVVPLLLFAVLIFEPSSPKDFSRLCRSSCWRWRRDGHRHR